MEPSFNTVSRLQSTAYYWTAQQIYSGSVQKGKDVLKFRNVSLSLTLQPCSLEFLTSANTDSKKKCFFLSALKHFEICQKKVYNETVWLTRHFYKNDSIHFSRDVRKPAVLNVLVIIRKMFLVAFLLRNKVSNLPTYNFTENWLHRKCFLCLFVPRIIKIAVRASVVESLFSKVTESNSILQLCQELHGTFRKVTVLEISRNPRFIGVATLQYKVCNATRNELLTKFLTSVLKLIENFQEVVSKRFLIRNIQTCKQQLSALRVFKTPEIMSTVEFLSSEAGADGFSTE